MRRYVFLLALVLAPAAALGQSIEVTSAYGPIEVVPASGAALVRVDSRSAELPVLHVGDEVRTGPGAQLTLQLPDDSYVVVAENTTFTVEQYQGSGVRNLMRVMLGKIRFYIQRLGGRPNPYRVNTPTALIAVRGTEFEVRVDAAAELTEVLCFDGRVTVERAGGADREVILDARRKTLIRAGQHPLMPVGLEEDFPASRILQVVRTDDAVSPGTVQSLPSIIPAADNDRRNRTVDPLSGPEVERAGTPILRGKLSYPR